MTIFRAYLVVVLAAITGYTMVVGGAHGWDFFPVFFANIAEMSWSGQFNLDFMSFLSLAGLWVAWRHQFSAGGIVLGLVALFGGMMCFAPYLLWASTQARGDARILLLGQGRAGC